MKRTSGKFVLRIPHELHLTLRKRSEKLGISLNSLCTEILSSSTSPVTAATPSFYTEFVPTSFLEELIEKWKDKICGVVLFGSVVRKEETEKSDVDLLLILKDDVSLERQLYSEWDSFYEKYRSLPTPLREISPQFVKLPKDPSEAGGLWYDIALEGTCLWQSNRIIFDVLQKIRGAMAEGHIKRCFSHGHPYWIKLNLNSDAEQISHS